MADDEEQGVEEQAPVREGWAPGEGEQPAGSIFIDTGRGQAAEVQVGASFVETIERIADEAHYGGYFRVFLNGNELTEDPWVDDAHTQLNQNYPATIEIGMRVAITSYDKVG